jgi:hypothetical protein
VIASNGSTREMRAEVRASGEQALRFGAAVRWTHRDDLYKSPGFRLPGPGFRHLVSPGTVLASGRRALGRGRGRSGTSIGAQGALGPAIDLEKRTAPTCCRATVSPRSRVGAVLDRVAHRCAGGRRPPPPILAGGAAHSHHWDGFGVEWDRPRASSRVPTCATLDPALRSRTRNRSRRAPEIVRPWWGSARMAARRRQLDIGVLHRAISRDPVDVVRGPARDHAVWRLLVPATPRADRGLHGIMRQQSQAAVWFAGLAA